LNGIQEVSGSIPLSSTSLRFERSEKTKTATAKRSEAGLITRVITAQNFTLAGISGVELFYINAFLILIQYE
jgi:hypothetical protein